MKTLILGALVALFAVWNTPAAPDKGASSDAKMERKPAPKTTLTDKQRDYLATYCKYRVIAIKEFKLKPEATLEDLRPHVAAYIELKKDTPWAMFTSSKYWLMRLIVVPAMTEERREKFSIILCGRKDATWVDLLFKLEELRLKRNSGEVARAHPPEAGCKAAGVAFSFYRKSIE